MPQTPRRLVSHGVRWGFLLPWLVAASLLTSTTGATADSSPTLTGSWANDKITLNWSGMPTDPVVKFSFTTIGPCMFGCEVLYPNSGTDTVDAPIFTAPYMRGFQMCSFNLDPQVCTNRVWLTVP